VQRLLTAEVEEEKAAALGHFLRRISGFFLIAFLSSPCRETPKNAIKINQSGGEI
jgi:hypothetical protein